MKKFQFRLERVYRFHKQRLKEAELRMAQAAMERDAAQLHVSRCEAEIVLSCQRNERAGTLIHPASRANLTAHVDYLGTILATARERLKAAEQRFRETDRVRAELTREVEKLSQFRDQQRLEHRDEVMRLQQIELDEVVMRQWSANSADDPLLSTGMPE